MNVLLQRSLLIISSILFVVSMQGCVTLGSPSGEVVVRDGNTRIAVSFNEHDRKLIHSYYGKKKQKHMPPGLAKKKKLPPGLHKQIVRKGKLPPGLRGRTLPHDLERKLSHLPDGYVRLRLGTDLVIMNTATRLVIDMIGDI